MKRIPALLILLAAATCAATASTPSRYNAMAERATRAYDGAEWSSAAAMYELLLDMRPDSVDTYAHAIVANEMVPDTAASVDLVERAMSHGLGLAEVLGRVRADSFAIGQGDRYGGFLLRLRNAFPWMGRALDNELLHYYVFRRNGPMMVRYARIMLEGLPESAEYRSILARGYILGGNDAMAVATWHEMLQADPDDYTALLSMGNYYVTRGRDAEAAPYLRRAMAIRPTPYVQATLDSLNIQK